MKNKLLQVGIRSDSVGNRIRTKGLGSLLGPKRPGDIKHKLFIYFRRMRRREVKMTTTMTASSFLMATFQMTKGHSK